MLLVEWVRLFIFGRCPRCNDDAIDRQFCPLCSGMIFKPWDTQEKGHLWRWHLMMRGR